MAVWLAKMLVTKGLRPVVVSRGYGGRLEEEAAVVSDGRQMFLAPDICGDEPYMMAMEKAFPVVVGKDRYKAGCLALKTFAPDVVILDDGFQHLKLERDLNLVLMDYRQPLGNNRMLPAGRLRETLGMAKARIDAVIFTRTPAAAFQQARTGLPANKVVKRLPFVPAFFCTHEPFAARVILPGGDTADKVNSFCLKGKTAVLFSGLARNASFAQSMLDLGVNIADHLEFCDHYRYKKPDFKRILARAKAVNADLVLTTQKDWVKVTPACFKDVTVGVIGIRMRFSDSQGLEKYILDSTFAKDPDTRVVHGN